MSVIAEGDDGSSFTEENWYYMLFLYSIIFLLINYSFLTQCKDIHILAVDVEAAGSQLCWPTIAVEFCHATYNLQSKKLQKLDQSTFAIEVKLDQLEPKCYLEYWQKNYDKFLSLQKNAVPYNQAAQEITKYVTNILLEYPDIAILTDNVSFDIARLNAILESCNSDPIAYRPDNTYQMPIDLSSLARAVAILKNVQDPWTCRHIKSELLLNDLGKEQLSAAYTMCWKYVQYMEEIHRHKKNNIIHLLGVDIKAAGAQLCWPTVSVGFCHATYDCLTRVVSFCQLQRFDIKVSLDEFEQKCYQDIWIHRKDTYELMQRNANSYELASRYITEYINHLLTLYPSIMIISDNIAFDIPRLNAILESQHKEPISYRPDQLYQVPIDLAEFERTLAILRGNNEVWSERDIDSVLLLPAVLDQCPVKNNNHLPEQAAAVTCWKYTRYLEEICKYNVHVI